MPDPITFKMKMKSGMIEKFKLFAGKSVDLLSVQEEFYVSQRIDPKKFANPQAEWLHEFIGEMTVRFNATVAKYVNDRAGEEIELGDIQRKFDRFRDDRAGKKVDFVNYN